MNNENAGNLDKISQNGWTHLFYTLTYKNVPIESAMLKVHIKDDVIMSINGTIYNDIDIDVVPIIDVSQALNYATSYIGAEEYSWEGNENNYFESVNATDKLYRPGGQLVIFPYKVPDKIIPRLSYKFDIYSLRPRYRCTIYIDACNGKVLYEDPYFIPVIGVVDTRYSSTRSISTQKSSGNYVLHDLTRGHGIYTYNLNHATVATTTDLDFVDNDNIWSAAEYHNSDLDDAALDAHWGAMMTYDFFKQSLYHEKVIFHIDSCFQYFLLRSYDKC